MAVDQRSVDQRAADAGLTLPWFIPSPEAQRERERLLASQFFLCKIAGNGDVWKCRRCGTKHRYLTWMCVEQPFSGLAHGLYAYYHTVGVQGAEHYLPTLDRRRYERLRQLFQIDRPDLATSHPETVRKLAVPENDADLGAFALGMMEDITAKEAADYVRRINDQGARPRFILRGLPRED